MSNCSKTKNGGGFLHKHKLDWTMLGAERSVAAARHAVVKGQVLPPIRKYQSQPSFGSISSIYLILTWRGFRWLFLKLPAFLLGFWQPLHWPSSARASLCGQAPESAEISNQLSDQRLDSPHDTKATDVSTATLTSKECLINLSLDLAANVHIDLLLFIWILWPFFFFF